MMVNENKVKMLTKLAGFEKRHYRTSDDIEKLRRGKYVAKGVWWTFCASTVAFIAMLVIHSLILNNTDEIFEDFLNGKMYMFTDLRLWIEYILFVSGFVIIALVFYNRKYTGLLPQLEEYKRRKNNYDDFYTRKEV